MKILILAQGTRGDVQPFIALGSALKLAGHEPILGIPSGFTSLAKKYNIKTIPIGNDRPGEVDSKTQKMIIDALQSGGLFRRKIAKRAMKRSFKARQPGTLETSVTIAEGHIDIVIGRSAQPWHHIAEWLSVPMILVCPDVSTIPTKSFRDPGCPIYAPKKLNEVSFYLGNWRHRKQYSEKIVDAWREDVLGLPLRSGSRNFMRNSDGSQMTVLQTLSKYLLPPGTQYPNWAYITGYWPLPSPPGWAPANQLADFLEDGEPPILVSFGSFGSIYTNIIKNCIRRAIHLSGLRAMIIGSRDDLELYLGDDRQLLVDDVPIDFILPRVRGIVHHGGTGTSSAALTAGCPQVVVPDIVPGRVRKHLEHNAEQMCANDVAIRPRLNFSSKEAAEELASAILDTVEEKYIIQRAKSLADESNAEGGVDKAIDIIENQVQSHWK